MVPLLLLLMYLELNIATLVLFLVGELDLDELSLPFFLLKDLPVTSGVKRKKGDSSESLYGSFICEDFLDDDFRFKELVDFLKYLRYDFLPGFLLKPLPLPLFF